MINRLLIGVVLILLCSKNIFGQSTLHGKIYESASDTIIVGVTVYNLSQQISSRSDRSGNFSIYANEGDKIIFSAVGYKPDTMIVSYYMLLVEYDVSMVTKIITLKPVTVYGSYEADSLARRNYYADIYSKQPGITGYNTPQYGVGVTLSPLSYFSPRARQKRQLKKRLIRQEEEFFIDNSFPRLWVENITGLRGDSLQLFMYRYRPSYSFCRKTDREGMIVYINDKLKEFRKPVELKESNTTR